MFFRAVVFAREERRFAWADPAMACDVLLLCWRSMLARSSRSTASPPPVRFAALCVTPAPSYRSPHSSGSDGVCLRGGDGTVGDCVCRALLHADAARDCHGLDRSCLCLQGCPTRSPFSIMGRPTTSGTETSTSPFYMLMLPWVCPRPNPRADALQRSRDGGLRHRLSHARRPRAPRGLVGLPHCRRDLSPHRGGVLHWRGTLTDGEWRRGVGEAVGRKWEE